MKRKRLKIRRLEESLRARRFAFGEKVKELEMVRRYKQDLLAKNAAGQSLVDNFMVFIEAIEKNGGRNGQESEMMQAIQTMLNSENGGGFVADYGDSVLIKTGVDLLEKAMADVIEAKKNSTDGCSGFAVDNEGVNNAAPETAQNPGEEATMVAVKGKRVMAVLITAATLVAVAAVASRVIVI